MKNLKLIAFLSLAGAPLASAANLSVRPPAPAVVSSSAATEIAPLAVQTYMDAYNQGAGHFLFGTSDPNGADCLAPTSCVAGSTNVGRAAYVGSFYNGGTNTFVNTNGNNAVSLLVYDASLIPAGAKSFALVFNNIQNFTGRGFRLAAKVLEARGDNGVDPGAEGAFKNNGPFGIPAAGALTTIFADGHFDNSDNKAGGVTVPANGPLVAHPAAPGPPYLTFDRNARVELGDISAAVAQAVASGVSYTACRHSCTPPLVRNVDCDLAIANPLYIAVTGQVGGGDRAAERVQNALTTDVLFHLHGDCDFAGESVPGTTTYAHLVAQ